MSVNFHFEYPTFEINEKKVEKWIIHNIEAAGKLSGDISIIFVDNSEILKFNLKFLNHNYHTDIITFNYNDKDIISGDLYISIDQVRINSKDFKNNFKDELLRVIIHGVLHLLGYNDSNPKEVEQMVLNENICLSNFNNF